MDNQKRFEKVAKDLGKLLKTYDLEPVNFSRHKTAADGWWTNVANWSSTRPQVTVWFDRSLGLAERHFWFGFQSPRQGRKIKKLEEEVRPRFLSRTIRAKNWANKGGYEQLRDKIANTVLQESNRLFYETYGPDDDCEWLGKSDVHFKFDSDRDLVDQAARFIGEVVEYANRLTPKAFLFTWKPEHWHHKKLRKIVDKFEANGTVTEPWRCHAHRQIKRGDRAYFLKQGKPSGVFGRGTVVGKPIKAKHIQAGANPWSVPICFDVLKDPLEHLLLDANQLSKLDVPPSRWRTQSSGISLESNAACQIDEVINLFRPAPLQTGRVYDDVAQETDRLKKLGIKTSRPEQKAFSEAIRRNYKDRCALTGCSTREAVEAAHIRVHKGRDINFATNGILLRSDIHALFDSFLITLSKNRKRVEINPKLTDPSYEFLRKVIVAEPEMSPPSLKNIRDHRKRFRLSIKIRET